MPNSQLGVPSVAQSTATRVATLWTYLLISPGTIFSLRLLYSPSARKLWKGRPSYKLTSLASAFGWEYEAHNALADSEICGRLFSMLCKGHIYTDEDARRFFHMVYKSRKSAFPRTI